MNKEEFMKLINDIPKSNNPSPISAYGSVSVEDICNAIDRLNKVPTYDELLKENEKLNHYKLLYQKVKERNDKAIEFIESKNNGICIVNGEEKGAYTFLLDFDKSREFVWSLLEILKGNNEE